MSTPHLALTLYSTAGCHLCEQALALVAHTCADQVTVTEVDIAESSEWMARYQWTIPVLQRQDTGAELGWPFDAGQLQAFVA